MTYSAPIYVDIEYTRGRNIIMHKDVEIGRMPIMLRSNKCILYDADESKMAKLTSVRWILVVTLLLTVPKK